MKEGVITTVLQPEWARGLARVVDGEVILDENRATTYAIGDPGHAERVALDLLGWFVSPKGRIGSEEAISFVRRHGLLWHGAEDLGSGDCREKLTEWWDAAMNLFIAVSTYQKITEALRSGSTQPLTRLNWLLKPSEFSSDEQYLIYASDRLAAWINEHLEGLWWGLVVHEPGDLRLGQAPPTLLASAWAAVADFIAQQVELKTCPNCGRLFRPEHGKQRYHNQSCANAHRWRRWKERQTDR